jgi:membrane protein implicated in regulation of membrane protease activity
MAYLLLNSLNLPKWKYLLVAIVFVLYMFVLPPYFFPENPGNKAMCGLPAMGITLAFWVCGTVALPVTHMAYLLARRVMDRKSVRSTK